MTEAFDDFTESEYSALLQLAKQNWRFIPFDEVAQPDGNVVLWRHDVDFSPHRALRLAQIESDTGVLGTYFVLLNSNFYNALEPKVVSIFRRIIDLGHRIGLHFDPSVRTRNAESIHAERALSIDRSIVEDYLGVRITVFSYHNPDTIRGGIPDADEIAGMTNAYGATLRRNFTYVSDSNGYWRFRRLRDVLQSAVDARLHVLTHPEWWVPTPASPRERVTRCIEGRARRQHMEYDEFLHAQGRVNVR